MAAIDTLAGITEISDNLYEVTSDVTLGSGIDDVIDSTFIMKSGGLLRWGAGCTTTFTNCVFHETDTAFALGSDNFQTYNSGYPTRFANTTAPVFRGCHWVCNTSTRSDFDCAEDAAMTFEKDDKGQKCRIIVKNNGQFLQFNHLTSGEMTINGLIIDQDGGGAALEFANFPDDPTQWADLEVVNYGGTDPARHASFLLYSAGVVPKTINQLNTRNVALIGSTSSTVRAVDPIGRIEKTNDVAFSDDGRWEVYRTYAGTLTDAVTGLEVSGRAVYTKNNEIYANEVRANYSAELLQYSQDFDTTTVVTEADYTEILEAWGYQTQVRTFTLQDETNPLANTKTTFVFADDNITESDRDVVRDYTVIDTADKLYDAQVFFTLRSYDPSIIGYDILTVSGSELDLGNHNMVVDPNLEYAFGYTNASNEAATGTPNLSRFTSGVRLYADIIKDTIETIASPITDAAFDAVVPAGNTYQLNSIQWNPDGTKLFAWGTSSSSDNCNVVLEYTLSTAYDMSTATLTATDSTGYINGQQGTAKIVDGGTTMIWAKRWGRWYYCTLSTPWDLSTAGAWSNKTMTARRTGFDFNHDGTKLFTSRDAQDTGSTFIYEYTLSTPYDISTRGAETAVNLGLTSFNSAISFNTQRDIIWLENGNMFLYNDSPTGKMYVYRVSTAYDVSTYSIEYTLERPLNGSDNAYPAITVNEEHDKLYLGYYTEDGGSYPIDAYEYYEFKDFNGDAETIYLKTSSLSASSKFDTIRTQGTVTFNNGASTDMIVIDANGIAANIAITNVVAGSRVYLYNATKDALLDNSISATSTYNYNYLTGISGAVIDSGDVLVARIAYCDGTTAYNWFSAFITAGEFGGGTQASQELLEAYPLLGVDGSTVTEFTLDIPNIDVDISDPDGTSQKRRLVAWLFYTIANDPDGMANFFGAIELPDGGNAILRSGIIDVELDNTGSTQVFLNDSDFWLYRDDGATFIKYPSSGGYGISNDSGKVYIAETGVSGLTSAESTQLFAIPTEGSGGGGATAVEIRQEIDANSTQLASIKSTVEAIPTDTYTIPDYSAELADIQTTVDGIPTDTYTIPDYSAELADIQTAVDAIDTDSLIDELEIINEGVKKSSLIVPHTTNLV
jgi:hypothetical protein